MTADDKENIVISNDTLATTGLQQQNNCNDNTNKKKIHTHTHNNV